MSLGRSNVNLLGVTRAGGLAEAPRSMWPLAVLVTSSSNGRHAVGGELGPGELAAGVSALGAVPAAGVGPRPGGLLGARLYAAGQTTGPPPPTVPLQHRGSPVPPGANPTAGSDAAGNASAPVCTGCGGPLRPEQRICTACSTPHEPTSPAPADTGEHTLGDESNETDTTDDAESGSLEVCATCGVELRAKHRFCTACGAGT